MAGVPHSRDACHRLSEGARITQTKVLVIGFEGLLSSSPINANLLATYRDKLATGQVAHRPLFLFGGSFLTRGPLVRIVEAYKNKVQVLVFGRAGMTGPDSIPAVCAAEWMKEKIEGRKVLIVGHSFGGGAAWELANALRSKGVSVDGVITADPRSPKMCMGECWSWAKPSNVKIWENCYQSVPLRGHPVPGARNHFQGAVGHASVQNTPCVYQSIANRITGVIGPATSAAPTHLEGGSGRSAALPSAISGIGNGDSGTLPATKDRSIAQVGGGRGIFAPYARGGLAGPGTKAESDWMERASHGTTGSSSASTLAHLVPSEPYGIAKGSMVNQPPFPKPDDSSGASAPRTEGDETFHQADQGRLRGDPSHPPASEAHDTRQPDSSGTAGMPMLNSNPASAPAVQRNSGEGETFTLANNPSLEDVLAANETDLAASPQDADDATLFARVHARYHSCALNQK